MPQLYTLQTVLIVLSIGILFSTAQTQTVQPPIVIVQAKTANHCLSTLPVTQNSTDSTYTELYQFDSEHASQIYQYTTDKVKQWLNSGNYLETAIHESNHHLNRILSRECEPRNKRKYFLIGNVFETNLQVGETPSINIINQTVPATLQRSERYSIYISANPNVHRNTLSSLLDELSAYTGEAWIHLARKQNPSTPQSLNYSQFQIDGMVNFMLYLQAYLKSSRLYYPDAYTNIQSQENTVAYMASLWKQAEDILLAAYPYIQDDRAAQHFFYTSDGTASAIEHLKQIYTSDMLTELELLKIDHLALEDFQNNYLHNR